MKRVLIFAVVVAGICHCTSSCAVTQTQNGILYVISNFTASGCLYYSWTNGSGSVLVAEDETKHESVVHSNVTSLLMNGCHEEIKYSCLSEKSKEHVSCYANCTNMQPQNREKVLGLLGLLGLLAVVVMILCYRYRLKLFRCWCSYSAVNQQNNPSTEDVEAQGQEMNLL